MHVLVEPDPRNWERIARGPLRRLLKCAIAKKTGWRDFWFSQGELGSGSILEPTGHLVHFPHIQFTQSPSPLPCYSLDDLYAICKLKEVDLLWVDIQGAEAEMIEGGANALSRTHYLFMEAEEVEFYAGQKLRPQLLEMLPDWKVIETLDYNLLLENTKCK
jgi:2-O-methyltransferase